MALWSVNTLAAQLLAELPRAAVGPGRTASDELKNIVRYALRHIWSVCDWVWYRKNGTLAIGAGDSVEDLPGDFRKLSSRWVKDNNEQSGWLYFTNSLDTLREAQTNYQTGD